MPAGAQNPPAVFLRTFNMDIGPKPLGLGGIVKRSLAMAFLRCGATITNACGLDDGPHDTAHDRR